MPRGGRKARQGIRLHYANLPADEVTTHRELRSAMRQAEQLRLTDRLWLGDLVERYPRKPGIPVLKAVVEEAQRGMSVVKSGLEERFQAFLIRADLPRPSTNVLVQGYEVDCAWEDARLVVELDSRTHHAVSEAFEADRVRDRRLEAEGRRVVRITFRQLHDTPGAVEADLRKLLAPRRPRAVPTRSRRR